MGSIENISELCRLCLVKDQVNVPIFEENATKEQTFVKINSCLPVKVSRDDSLPKKICDGCSCKLDMLYTFRNTSVDSEKQLLKWLNQAGLSCSQSAVKDPLASTKPEVTIKQETFEPTDSRDDLGLDTHSYIMQQQKLPYSQEFEFGEPSESNVGLMTDEPAPKKAKRAAALNKASVETDEDDLDAAMQITKAEDEDSDEIDQPEYVEAPSTSADDQPGPSGVNKTTVEAPFGTTIYLNSFECKICTKWYATKAQYNRHMLLHGEKKHKCPSCDKMFHRPWDVKLHIQSRHNESSLLKCSSCNFIAKTKGSLTTHTITNHTKQYPVKCDLCDKGFFCNSQVIRHKNIDHEGLRLICAVCSKIFKDPSYFQRHVRRHNPDHVVTKYTCKECCKVLSTSDSFHKHMRRHREEGNAVCDTCGKTFVTLANLKIHKKKHTGEKNYVCEVCAKAFTRKEFLVMHMRVHTKDKPFKCMECDKAFTQKSSLNIHMRAHTGETPYECNLCNKKCVSRAALKSHRCQFL
ncbi:zinc finger protein 84 isoform X28 [Tribolium castaneum]|uniref:zinc finger protein 84 isoform X28 n=1 Tax=Tribolium castaneum TaxID=7070 RepID=UPI00077DAC5E|nr:PREDICTED: zinc finger protein 84 isoform X34 [Tribolium castaneum]|eukprot:XP_015834151.1 PREDICTED: zinc finger protein 84 isoform X34 [Tribolium castaneum]